MSLQDKGKICKENYPYSCMGKDQPCCICGHLGRDHIFRNGSSICYKCNEQEDAEEKLRLWCTKCDVDMIKKGIALDCPRDGIFYECPSCNYKIVIFKKEVD